MAGTASGAGLLESGAKGRLVARSGGRLKAAKLRHHIRICGFEAGPVSPNSCQGARITCTAARRETGRKAFKKLDHFSNAGGGSARVATLVNHGLDAFHLARNALQPIPPRGNDIALRQGRGCHGEYGGQGSSERPGFHGDLRNQGFNSG
jgi:hypothetical protein